MTEAKSQRTKKRRSDCKTPTGFEHSAQGCAARLRASYPGNTSKRNHNPERVGSIRCLPFREYNPFRVEGSFVTITQGSPLRGAIAGLKDGTPLAFLVSACRGRILVQSRLANLELVSICEMHIGHPKIPKPLQGCPSLSNPIQGPLGGGCLQPHDKPSQAQSSLVKVSQAQSSSLAEKKDCLFLRLRVLAPLRGKSTQINPKTQPKTGRFRPKNELYPRL
jgi:hypothetical protein